MHENGYRHEVEVSDCSYFGRRKSYATESDSRQACAYTALQEMLVFGDNAFSNSSPSSLKKTDESLLALVPRVPNFDSRGSICTTRQAVEPVAEGSEGSKVAAGFGSPLKRAADSTNADPATAAPGNSKKRKMEQPRNANLQPLGKPRLADIKVCEDKDVNSKWQATYEDLLTQTRDLEAPSAQLESNIFPFFFCYLGPSLTGLFFYFFFFFFFDYCCRRSVLANHPLCECSPSLSEGAPRSSLVPNRNLRDSATGTSRVADNQTGFLRALVCVVSGPW